MPVCTTLLWDTLDTHCEGALADLRANPNSAVTLWVTVRSSEPESQFAREMEIMVSFFFLMKVKFGNSTMLAEKTGLDNGNFFYSFSSFLILCVISSWMCVHACACVWKPEFDIRCLPQSVSTCSLKMASLTEPGALILSWVGRPTNPGSLLSPPPRHWHYKRAPPCLAF